MAYTFGEFKEEVKNRNFFGRQKYVSIVEDIQKLYDESTIKFFYPKNLTNDKEKELYIFFQDGYLLIQVDGQPQNKYQHYYCKPVSKTLVTSEYGVEELKVEFNNSQTLIFNDLADSNSEWRAEYTDYIKELYKII
ncbi:DUF3908 family protein [Priestia megaterium]|uniref:DUF3908 family protein n=1 Tax=Priestia megaterium TaxID=1404 RepID=UPI0027A1EF1C|nr:DUF3908 family protein [Priestia megaterium]WDC90586.1 DUF3908 family protein [Priestia megaterium]